SCSPFSSARMGRLPRPGNRGRKNAGTMNRRRWLRNAAAAGLGFGLVPGCSRPRDAGAGRAADGSLLFPGKVPMRVLGDRPPNIETPWQYFQTDLTPVEAFFVRWHLQFIPTAVDLRTWRLPVGGHVDRPMGP